MNVFSKLLGAFLLILFSVTAQAQNYYVCDSTGDDNNLGQSESKPFKTYDKAIGYFNQLQAGGSLLFCRGDEFPATISVRLNNSRCQADKPCSIGDYGNESLPRPIIAAYGIHAFNFENGGAPKPDGGYRVENLTIMAAEKSGAGIRMYNDVNDMTISNVHIEGFNIGVYSANSNAATEGSSSNEANDRIILRNSNIINNLKIGFLGSCNDCLIEGNNFESNGTHPSLDHNIYLSGSKIHKRGITVRNNTLYRSAIVDGICQGVSLVGHGLLEDVLIENNIIKEDPGKVSNGCWGISIDPGYRTVDESFRNIVIRNNKVINVGGNGIGCASCDGVLIEGNEIIDEAKKTTAGIKVPVRDENSTKSKNVIVKNNKVILSLDSATGIWIGGENVSQVKGNEIVLPLTTRSECIIRNEASLSIDISSNTCKNHNGVAIIDEQDHNDSIHDEEQIAESPVEDTPIGEQEVVDNSSVDETSNNQDQEIVDNSPIQEENANQNIVDNSPANENTNEISETSDTVLIKAQDLAETEGINDENTLEPTTSVTSTETNGSKVGLNEQIYDDGSSSTLKSKPRNATGGGSSKSKKTATTTTDLAANYNVVTYPAVEPAVESSTSIMSVETEQMDITRSLSKTDTESSKYSVKVKDVIKASHDDNQVADVTQCRAYAAGRCLMK